MISDEKQAIHVIAEAVAKPGQEEALYRTLHACVAPTRDEAGNRGNLH
jgi:quinol monooxygenase YgiN